MGTKMEVSFANIYMAEIEMKLIQQGETKPREWKLYFDDVFSLWDCDRKEVNRFKFKQRLKARGYPENIIERSLLGVNFAFQSALTRTQKPKGHERLLPFVKTLHPSVRNLKQILMEHWSLIHNQPLLKTIFTKPPIMSYKKGKFLKDTLVRAKI